MGLLAPQPCLGKVSWIDAQGRDVEQTFRPALLKDLALFGISHASMFPGLEGPSRAINWQYSVEPLRSPDHKRSQAPAGMLGSPMVAGEGAADVNCG